MGLLSHSYEGLTNVFVVGLQCLPPPSCSRLAMSKTGRFQKRNIIQNEGHGGGVCRQNFLGG